MKIEFKGVQVVIGRSPLVSETTVQKKNYENFSWVLRFWDLSLGHRDVQGFCALLLSHLLASWVHQGSSTPSSSLQQYFTQGC